MHKHLSDKPIIEMTNEERERTFDMIGKSGDIKMLNEARNNQCQELLIAVAVLNPGEHLVIWTAEYGDGEGIRFIGDSILGWKRLKLLKKGESLEGRVLRVSISDVIKLTK